MCRSLKLSWLCVVLISVGLAACAPAAAPAPQVVEVTKVVEVMQSVTATPAPTARPAYKQLPLPEPSISEKVKVDDTEMWLECYGSGRPTIILEHGYRLDSSSWRTIIPQLAAETQVCAYDRINAGQSTITTNPRTMAQAGAELDALLQETKIEGPYIIAGHSLGGLYVLTYASEHPDQVAGAVLVDSAVLDDCQNTLKVLPTPSSSEARIISDIREGCKISFDQQKPEGIVDVDPAVRAVTSLGDVPLVVLVHGSSSKIGQEWYPGAPADLVNQLEQLWQSEQTGYTKLSTDSTYVLAEQSGHVIQNDEPQLVIDAILRLVDKARQK
jgi:pimeloyl-ACP methyl ester carboxylesterase